MNKTKKATLCFLINNQQILLAMKKRGFGGGKWNGVGGKQNEGETIEETSKREAFEEIGVKIINHEKVAVFDFVFIDKPEWNLEVHVYKATKWGGEPTESEEMSPKWFDYQKVPYQQMWDDDKLWLPKMIEGKKQTGTFRFDDKGQVINYELKEILGDLS